MVRRTVDSLAGVTDIELLNSLLLNDPDPAVRLAALARIDDVNLFTIVAIRHPDREVALAAVCRISVDEQSALVSVARRTMHSDVLLRAIISIRDQDYLASVLRMATPPKHKRVWANARQLAANGVRDPAMTAYLTRDRDPYIRSVCAAATQDQVVLKRLALGDKEVSVRKIAVNKLLCTRTLETSMRSDTDADLRVAAAARLSQVRQGPGFDPGAPAT